MTIGYNCQLATTVHLDCDYCMYYLDKVLPSRFVNFSPRFVSICLNEDVLMCPVFPLSCATKAAFNSCCIFSTRECSCITSRNEAKSIRPSAVYKYKLSLLIKMPTYIIPQSKKAKNAFTTKGIRKKYFSINAFMIYFSFTKL